MKHTLLAFLLALSFLLSPAAYARDEAIVVSGLQGHDLLGLCTSPAGSAELNFCFGYIEGIRDGLVWLAAARKSKASISIPNGVTKEQLATVIVKYLNSHPERKARAAGILVFVALKQAFPPKP